MTKPNIADFNAQPLVIGTIDPWQLSEPEARAELNYLETYYAGPHGPCTPSLTTTGAIESLKIMVPRQRALRERLGMMFWQRTQRSVWIGERMPEHKHHQYVEAALAEGKPVPAEVLADYPDLATKGPGI